LQRSKVIYDKLLSKFTIKCKVRPCTKLMMAESFVGGGNDFERRFEAMVGRCSFTPA